MLGNNNLDAIGVKQGLPMAQTEAMKGANPRYNLDLSYKINCQRCVPTYEMRRRGYDVAANPNNGGISLMGKEFFVPILRPVACRPATPCLVTST